MSPSGPRIPQVNTPAEESCVCPVCRARGDLTEGRRQLVFSSCCRCQCHKSVAPTQKGRLIGFHYNWSVIYRCLLFPRQILLAHWSRRAHGMRHMTPEPIRSQGAPRLSWARNESMGNFEIIHTHEHSH